MKRELKKQFNKTEKSLKPKAKIKDAFDNMKILMEIVLLYLKEREAIMDEKIKKIIKDTKGLEKKEKKLLKMDKKQDKIVEKAKKKLKK